MKSKEGKSTTDGTAASWGVFLALISGFVYSISTLIVKYIKNIHPAQLLMYRSFAATAFSLPQFIFSQQASLCPQNIRVSMLFLTISSMTGVLLQYVVFRYLPLGEAAALISSYPIFVTIGGRVFMKESLGLVQVISLLTTMGGLVFVTGVYQVHVEKSRIYTTENIYGIISGLASLFVCCAFILLMRKLKNIHSSIIIINSGLFGMIEGAIITFVFDKFRFHYGGAQQCLIILLGLCSYLTTVCLTLATQCAEAGPVSIMRAASDMFFSFLWQVILFQDVPDPITIFGAILVCVSVVLTGFNKKINELLPDRCVRFC